jgi:hypothetical protein
MKSKTAFVAMTLFLIILAGLRVCEADKFEDKKLPEIANLAPDSLRPDFVEALKDAGENWRELAGVAEELQERKRDDAIWLINHMPHLDRLEMKSDILREHIEYAYIARDSSVVSFDDKTFQEYILTYRLGSEPVEAYRKFLFEYFRPQTEAKKDAQEVAKQINRWVEKNLSIKEKTFFGPLQPPTATFKSRKGSEREISILVTAIFKSLGIPSRQARISALGEQEESFTWVEVFDGENWLPFYPFSPKDLGNFGFIEKGHRHNVTVVLSRSAFERRLITDQYTDTGWLKAQFLEEGKPKAEFEHLSVNVFNQGAFRALDDLFLNDYVDFPSADSSGIYICELGDGSYFLQAGLRQKSGDVWVQIFPFKIVAEETTFVEVELSPVEK